MEILSSTDFWKIVFPALAAVVVWFLNERSKLAWEQYKRKEENYKELLRCLRGFYVSNQDRHLKLEFVHQVNLLWLYAPDHVVKAAYQFLRKIQTAAQDKEFAFGYLVAAARADLLSRKIVRRSELE